LKANVKIKHIEAKNIKRKLREKKISKRYQNKNKNKKLIFLKQP
jgi:hypothetical protein